MCFGGNGWRGWRPSLIAQSPGLGRSAGEGIGYPLQYSWASLVAQLVKNSAAMGETWVRSLGLDDRLEKGKYSGLKNSMDNLDDLWDHKESDRTEQLSLSLSFWFY